MSLNGVSGIQREVSLERGIGNVRGRIGVAVARSVGDAAVRVVMAVHATVTRLLQKWVMERLPAELGALFEATPDALLHIETFSVAETDGVIDEVKASRLATPALPVGFP